MISTKLAKKKGYCAIAILLIEGMIQANKIFINTSTNDIVVFIKMRYSCFAVFRSKVHKEYMTLSDKYYAASKSQNNSFL